MTQPLICVVCQRREVRTGMVCDPDRTRLARTLDEIVELYALLPEQLAPGQSAGERVSGSREAPLPLRVDPLDLTMPARAAAVSDGLVPQFETVTVEALSYLPTEPDVPKYSMVTLTLRQRQVRRDGDGLVVFGPSGDQIGQLSVASRLDSWVQDWRSSLVASANPGTTVVELAGWLRIWLEAACQDYMAIDDFADDVFSIASVLRSVCGTKDIKPELLDAECSRCDQRAMYRLPGEDRVECGGCGRRLTEDEYHRWVGLSAADKEARVAVMESMKCRNCDNEIGWTRKGDQPHWTHVGDWQGRRCLGALTGAAPADLKERMSA